MTIVIERIKHASESFRLLAWTKDISNVEVLGPQNARSPLRGEGHHLHVHSQAELTLVERGTGTRLVGDSIEPIKAPELVLFGPYVPHCWNCRGQSRGMALQFPVDDSQPLRTVPEWSLLESTWRVSSRGIQFPPEIADDVRNSMKAMIDRNGLVRLAHFMQVLAAIGGHKGMPISKRAYSSAITTRHFPAIQKAVLTILDRYHEKLELNELIRASELSRATFCREFKNFTGRTFVDFLNEVRINAVCQQLLQTDAPVGDIAYRAGFGNLSHFNRIFRRLRGKSPADFRRRYTHQINL